MFFGLRKYQLDAMQFAYRQRRVAMWLPMGLGKTLTTLATVDADPSMLPALIVGPKRVVEHVWAAELAKWGFRQSIAIASGTPAKKRKAIAAGADITCISANSLKYAIGGPWRTIVLDEATMFKNPKSARWKAAKQLAEAANIITLTGSPTSGAGLADLWGQIDLLFPGGTNPLGTYWQFLQRHFTFDHFNRPHPRRGAEERVAEIIRPWVFQRTLDEIVMPGIITVDVDCPMTAAQQIAMEESELSEAGAFVEQRQIASGFRYDQHWSGTVDTEWMAESKMDAMQEIRLETGRDSLLVLCNFRAEVDRLRDEFNAEVIDGRTSAKSAAETIARWNAREIPMLVGNCAAMSHGLNLQSGGHRVIWFSLPVSQEIYDQAVARLWRSGQENAVIVHRLIANDSIDQKIAKLLDRKMLSQAALLRAVGC